MSFGRTTRLVLVVASSLSYMGTFGLVLLYDLLNTGSGLFGDYAIALGLSRGFMMAASLRARLVVLASATPTSDYAPLRGLVIAASLIGVSLSAAIALDTDFLVLAVLIACVRMFENIYQTYISLVQVTVNRDRAIGLSLIPNVGQVLAYATLFVTHSLVTTIALEVLVTMAVCLPGFRRRLTTGDRSQRLPIVRAVSGFTTASLLNNLIGTILIRSLLGMGEEELAGLAAGFFVAAAVAARLAANSALFYVTLVKRLVSLATHRGLFKAIPLAVGLAGAALTLTRIDPDLLWYLVVPLLVLMNTVNLLVRQSVSLEGDLRLLIVLHIVELAGGLVLFRWIDDVAALCLVLLGWQVFRAYSLVPIWVRAVGSVADHPAEANEIRS